VHCASPFWALAMVSDMERPLSRRDAATARMARVGSEIIGTVGRNELPAQEVSKHARAGVLPTKSKMLRSKSAAPETFAKVFQNCVVGKPCDDEDLTLELRLLAALDGVRQGRPLSPTVSFSKFSSFLGRPTSQGQDASNPAVASMRAAHVLPSPWHAAAMAAKHRKKFVELKSQIKVPAQQAQKQKPTVDPQVLRQKGDHDKVVSFAKERKTEF